MGINIEGNDVAGYRVVDDEIGALTGRQRSEEDALNAAGVDAKDLTSDAKAAPKARAKAAPKAAEPVAEPAITTKSGE